MKTYKNHSNDHDFFQEDHISRFLRQHKTGTDNNGRIRLGELIHENKYSTILDVASGSCVNYETWKGMNCKIKYTGFDLTQNLLNEARRRYGSEIELKHGYAQELLENFQPKSFDFVVIRHYLEHAFAGQYETIIKQALEIADKELVIVFFLDLIDGPDDIIEERSSNIEGKPEITHFWSCFSKDKLFNFLSTLGCQIKIEYVVTQGAAANDTIIRLIK